MSDKYIQDAEEYKLRDIFDKLSVGIAVVNRDGFVVYANEADCRFLGYSLQELKGIHFKGGF